MYCSFSFRLSAMCTLTTQKYQVHTNTPTTIDKTRIICNDAVKHTEKFFETIKIIVARTLLFEDDDTLSEDDSLVAFRCRVPFISFSETEYHQRDIGESVLLGK